MRRILAPLALLVLAASTSPAAPTAGAADGPALLRFKPSPVEERQVMSKTERITTEHWDGTRQDSTVVVNRTLLRTAQPLEGDAFSVTAKVTDESVTLNGKAAPRLPHPTETRFSMTGRGDILPSAMGRSASIAPDVRLVLPEGAVLPGARWSETLPATEGFPAPLELHFKLSGTTTYRGIPCAVIDGRCSFDGAFDELGCRARVQITSRSYFDPKAGRLVGVVSSSSFILTYLRPYPERPRQSTTETKLKVVTAPAK